MPPLALPALRKVVRDLPTAAEGPRSSAACVPDHLSVFTGCRSRARDPSLPQAPKTGAPSRYGSRTRPTGLWQYRAP